MNDLKPSSVAFGQRARRWITPIVAASFTVTGTTGVSMLFHVGRERWMAVHEWLGAVAVMGVVLHVWANWRAFARQFRTAIGLGTSIAALAIAGALLSHGHPDVAGRAARMLTDARLGVIAELRREPTEKVVAKLQAAGWRVAGSEQTLREIARDNGRSERHLVILLLGDRDAD